MQDEKIDMDHEGVILIHITKQRRAKSFPSKEIVSLAPPRSNETKAIDCVTGDLVGKVDTVGSLLWYFLSSFVLMYH